MASKLCDSCKSAPANLYCRADAAFLCMSCDAEVHAANKLASRHARVWVCEVCEQAPAHVTCKADAAALCVTCDQDIHSANPLARRHDRVPIVPLYDPPPPSSAAAARPFFSDRDAAAAAEEEAEAASWLLPNPKSSAAAAAVNVGVSESPDLNSADPYSNGFSEMEPYLDLDHYGNASIDLKLEEAARSSVTADGVVPVIIGGANSSNKIGGVTDNCFDLDFSSPPSKPFLYAFGNPSSHCLTQSMSSSSMSMEVGVVPDGDTAAKQAAVPMTGADREARVMRYREKRKNRKFEKTIRYASRKAYAETRPRIKGRFAKRTEVDLEADRISGYGVVPTY